MSKLFFTVDVEDWFQVENFKDYIEQSSWDELELRVVENTNRVLNLLKEQNCLATFFVLGWIAERCPNLVRKISELGHEIASHGYDHDLVYDLTPDKFRDDVRKSKEILESITGKKIRGYRAPSFSITEWGLNILKEEGYIYDSSVFDVEMHDRYSSLSLDLVGEGYIKRIDEDFFEVPITTYDILGKKIPWGGGGYFRLMPYSIFKYGLKASIEKNAGGCFYSHPWEYDPTQPKMKKVKPLYKFRHYVGLKSMETKINRLLSEFDCTTIYSGLEEVK